MKRKSENILVEWLVLGAQGGDGDALVELIQILYPKLLRYAVRQLNNEDNAKDVVQNVFEVLSRDLKKVKDPAAFMGWVYQVTHRKGADYIREKQRQRKLHEHYEYEQSIHTPEPEPEDSDSMRLDDLLRKLDSTQYQLVHLYYLEGFSVNEIAKVLKLPNGTIKSRLFKVRQHLSNLTREQSHEEH